MDFKALWKEGEALLAAKKRRQFIDVMAPALAKAPTELTTKTPYSVHFDRLIHTCQLLKSPVEVASLCERISLDEIRRRGETAGAILGLGVAAMAREELHEADVFMSRAATMPGERWTIALGVFNHRSPGYLRQLFASK